jgi:chromosome segregation ATPase
VKTLQAEVEKCVVKRAGRDKFVSRSQSPSRSPSRKRQQIAVADAEQPATIASDTHAAEVEALQAEVERVKAEAEQHATSVSDKHAVEVKVLQEELERVAASATVTARVAELEVQLTKAEAKNVKAFKHWQSMKSEAVTATEADSNSKAAKLEVAEARLSEAEAAREEANSKLSETEAAKEAAEGKLSELEAAKEIVVIATEAAES